MRERRSWVASVRWGPFEIVSWPGLSRGRCTCSSPFHTAPYLGVPSPQILPVRLEGDLSRLETPSWPHLWSGACLHPSLLFEWIYAFRWNKTCTPT